MGSRSVTPPQNATIAVWLRQATSGGARLNWQAAYDADLLVGGGETCDGGATVARLEETDRYQRRAGHARLAPSALRPGRPRLASVVTAPEWDREQASQGGQGVVAFALRLPRYLDHRDCLGSP